MLSTELPSLADCIKMFSVHLPHPTKEGCLVKVKQNSACFKVDAKTGEPPLSREDRVADLVVKADSGESLFPEVTIDILADRLATRLVGILSRQNSGLDAAKQQIARDGDE